MYNDIKHTDIKILYVIDKIAENEYHGIPVAKLENIKKQPVVDAVIITPICDYVEIMHDMEKYDTELLKLSLEQLVL